MTDVGKNAPGLRGFPTPNTAADTFAYLLFYFNDPVWAQYLLGAARTLTDVYNWYEAGDMSPDDAAEAFRQIVQDAPYNILPSADECTLPDGGRLLRLGASGHTEMQDGSSWVEPNGDYTVPPVPARSGGTPEDQMCLAAANAAHAMELLYEQLSDDWNAGLSTAEAIADLVTGVGALIGAPFGLAAEALIAIARLVFQVVYETVAFVGADVWTNDFTSVFRQVLRCCASNDAGVVTFDFQCVIDALASQTNVFDLTFVQLRLFGQLNFILQWIGADGLNAAGATTAVTAATCDECTWCYYFDFSASENSWYVSKPNTGYPSPAGTWAFGGWEITLTTDGTGAKSGELSIQRTFDADLTNIDVYYDRQAGTYNDAGYTYRLSADGNVNSRGTDFQSQASPGVSGTDLVLSWAGTRTVSALTIAIQCSHRIGGANPTTLGSAILRAVRLRGTGVNPFGASQCP